MKAKLLKLPNQLLFNQVSQYISKQGGRNYCLFLLGSQAGLRVSEAISFDYRLKHSRHKNLYLVQGKGNKKRYVYVSLLVIGELKANSWKPNQTNRINFYNFLQKTKQELGISKETELTPHTLRRCFTTYQSLKGVPMPVLQKALGHKNIRTTAYYWKGSVDIREFEEWLEPENFVSQSRKLELERVPKVAIRDNSHFPQLPEISPKLKSPPEYLKVIQELKKKLAEKDKELIEYKNEILVPLIRDKRKFNNLAIKNKSLIQNYTNLKNTAKNQGKIKEKPKISLKSQNSITFSDKKSQVNNLTVEKFTKLIKSAENKPSLLEYNTPNLTSSRENKNQMKEQSRKLSFPTKNHEPREQPAKKEQILLTIIKKLETNLSVFNKGLREQLKQVRSENEKLIENNIPSIKDKKKRAEVLVKTEKQRTNYYQQQLKIIFEFLYRQLEKERAKQKAQIEQTPKPTKF